jgi:Arc/MetJ family transcription regulator
MRTTITIDDELLAEAKAAAAKSGRTLNAVVEDALREAFARRREQRPRLPPVSDAKGWVRPGVNIDSNAELLDLMEEDGHWS